MQFGSANEGGLTYGDGVLYSVDNWRIKAWDPSTGTELMQFGSANEGGLAAVPLPAGVYLFLSGLVGLGLIKSKKK